MPGRKLCPSTAQGFGLLPQIIKMQRNANGSPPEMVKILCRQGRLREALYILHSMEQRVGSVTYICLLQGCTEKKALEEGRLVHTHMKERRFQILNTYLWNTLLNMYAKCGSLADARRVFDEMPERDVFSWTVIIQAYASRGLDEEVMLLFRQMQQTDIKPNHFTLSSVLPVCGRLAALGQGMEIHEEIIRGGFQFNLFVGNALIDMYGKCGKVDDACHLFGKMPQRDVVSWNAMLAGYGQNGRIDEASKLFEKMPERNIVSWNTIIAGYVQNGYFDNALKQFRKMPRLGVRPDLKTFASILPACASLGALAQGMEIHEEIVKSGFQSDVFVESALVDMYAKCGSIEKARDLFDKMSERNVVSWTAMIAGYAVHGCVEEALELFEQMQRSALNPNHVTLVSVLSACCHAGLVDKGCKYFDLMRGHYGIRPTMEHYGCMVDLLARAGHLDEAHNFINNMPVKPDATVWMCLLGACRIHNNKELGEHAAKQLFELNPKDATPYVLLSNIYAAAGRWNDIENLREMMIERRVKKKPGCSWIEVTKLANGSSMNMDSIPKCRKSMQS